MARTVLLADDSVTAQNMGRRILMDAGYEVVTVNNGSAALKKIHEQRPDLIVLDVYMPGYGGLEVCQRLKESADTARIPVLLSVGKMEPFKAEEAKRVRADGHIVKPFEASELLAALTKLEDRIVPPESRDGRPGKSEKRGRSWQTEDSVAGAEEVRTERVAHLSEAKKRHASSASDEAVEAEVKPVAVENVAVTSNEAKAFEVVAPVEVDAAETPAIAGDSQEWVLGKSLFGKPVHGELALGESIFDKTVVGKSVAGESASEAPTAAIANSLAPGPRWIAESVALTAEEASLDLGELMQRSRAVSRAVAIAAEIPPQEQVTASALVVAQAGAEAHAVAELETGNPAGAAFAAAAAAGAAGISSQNSAFGTQPAQDKENSEAPAETTVSAPDAEPPVAPEAAAAWENWQQIRDSVMSPKNADALAETVAEMAAASSSSTSQARVSAPESTPEFTTNQDPTPSVIAATAAAEEVNSINDIVDSVLADLKPRLMAEISKKLAAKK